MLSGRGHILALFIVIFLFLAQSALAEPSRIIEAKEIIEKIEQRQPVAYENVIVKGDLNLSRLDNRERKAGKENIQYSAGRAEIDSPLRISNSVILNQVYLNKLILKKPVDFHGTRFMSRVSLMIYGSMTHPTSITPGLRMTQTSAPPGSMLLPFFPPPSSAKPPTSDNPNSIRRQDLSALNSTRPPTSRKPVS